MNILIVPVLILLGLFFVLYFFERRTMWIGLVALLAFITSAGFMIIAFEIEHQSLALSIALFLAAILVLFIPAYIVSFILLSITSGIRLIKREGKRLHNFLSLGLGLGLIIWLVLSLIITIPEEYNILGFLYNYLTLTVYYLLALLVIFAISSAFNRIPRFGKKYDYIIVLGARVIGGKVTPLLASRIDKAMQIYQEQQANNYPSKLIFTGGQGSDEAVSEGLAMANYAKEKGLPSSAIIVEDQAINTYENLLFSQKLIEQDSEKEKPEIITVTNNFHVFRALLWARKVGMKCDGAGSSTRFYFWLNALIREFIGTLVMQKKSHMTVLIIALLVMTLLEYFNYAYVLM